MTGSAAPEAAAALSHEARVKRAIWRAGHRGTKEMDIMLGRFAQERAVAMSPEQLARFEMLLQLPDPDLQRWLIDPAPALATGAEAGADDAGRQDFAPEIAAIRQFHHLRA